MKLEDVHTCKESEGKIVCISIDLFGNTFCTYCGKQVNYKQVNYKPEDLKD
jgi:hypothetical protein